jgi:integrase
MSRSGQDLLFANSECEPYNPEEIVKKFLKPILRELKIDGRRKAMHAFRHCNISAMDSMNTPMKVRQDRVGHANSRTTMGYTHASSADHRIVADALGEMFDPGTEPDVEMSYAAGAD